MTLTNTIVFGLVCAFSNVVSLLLTAYVMEKWK